MLIAVALTPVGASFALYSWAFLLGTLVAVAVAVWLAWHAFSITLADAS